VNLDVLDGEKKKRGCLRTQVLRQPSCLRIGEDKKEYDPAGIFLSGDEALCFNKTAF
jgi:hypothetical protein